MKNLKKLTAVLCTLVMLLALCACGNTAAPAADPTEAPAAEESSAPSDDVAADQTFVVGICQLVQHDALDTATEGFKQALTDKLGDKVTFQEGNASGDPATCSVIINQFVSDDVDLIMANATPALLAAVAATNDIPILGTSVTDYGSALEISDWTGATGFNVSGTSDLAPLDGQAAVLKELCPDAKVVGILYCSGEPNSKFQADTITRCSRNSALRSRNSPSQTPTMLQTSPLPPAPSAMCSTSRPITPPPPAPRPSIT